ncbi:zinc finger protein 613-like [Anopheles bellator]|uniref:zinc finger protein 613-like n=1 Tax=Anopheles bellator TaxID=139047 RepID=UPI00264722F8|nr:zinc finger protein 613-like [Anopheles bellator]
MNDLCRLCLKKCELFGMHITSADGLLRNVPKMLQECISIEVNDREPNMFSKLICNDCLYKLELFAAFREQSLKSQEYYYGLVLYYQQPAPCSSTAPVMGAACEVFGIVNGLQTGQQADPEHHTEDDAQHHQILADINFTGNEFMMDETEKSQLNKDYDDIIRSLEKDDLDFTTNDDDFQIKNELGMTISKTAEQKYCQNTLKEDQQQQQQQQSQDLSHLEQDHRDEQVLLSDTATRLTDCFNPYDEIAQSIATDGTLHQDQGATEDDGIDYDDFVGMATPSDVHQETSISDIQVQHLMEDVVQGEGLAMVQTGPSQDASVIVSSTDELLQEQPTHTTLTAPDTADEYQPQPSEPEMLTGHTGTSSDDLPPDGKTCGVCFKTFRSRHKLKRHLNTHLRLAPFKCTFDGCTKAFKSRIGLEEHLARHNNTFEYSCDICSKGFQNRSYLTAHRRAHNTVRNFQCNLCGQTFKAKQAMLNHKNRHLGLKPFACDHCDKQFTTNPLLQRHVLEKHPVTSATEVRYPCEDCGKSFTSRSYLKVHRKIHRNERSFVCEICQRGHITRVDLEVHMTTHTGEKPYICEICGKGYSRRNALYCHRRTHTKERPYSCDICGHVFSQYTPLQVHRRTHHESGKWKAQGSTEEAAPQQDLRCTIFACMACDFATESSLEEHIKINHSR